MSPNDVQQRFDQHFPELSMLSKTDAERALRISLNQPSAPWPTLVTLALEGWMQVAHEPMEEHLEAWRTWGQALRSISPPVDVGDVWVDPPVLKKSGFHRNGLYATATIPLWDAWKQFFSIKRQPGSWIESYRIFETPSLASSSFWEHQAWCWHQIRQVSGLTYWVSPSPRKLTGDAPRFHLPILEQDWWIFDIPLPLRELVETNIWESWKTHAGDVAPNEALRSLPHFLARGDTQISLTHNKRLWGQALDQNDQTSMELPTLDAPNASWMVKLDMDDASDVQLLLRTWQVTKATTRRLPDMQNWEEALRFAWNKHMTQWAHSSDTLEAFWREETSIAKVWLEACPTLLSTACEEDQRAIELTRAMFLCSKLNPEDHDEKAFLEAWCNRQGITWEALSSIMPYEFMWQHPHGRLWWPNSAMEDPTILNRYLDYLTVGCSDPMYQRVEFKSFPCRLPNQRCTSSTSYLWEEWEQVFQKATHEQWQRWEKGIIERSHDSPSWNLGPRPAMKREPWELEEFHDWLIRQNEKMEAWSPVMEQVTPEEEQTWVYRTGLYKTLRTYMRRYPDSFENSSSGALRTSVKSWLDREPLVALYDAHRLTKAWTQDQVSPISLTPRPRF